VFLIGRNPDDIAWPNLFERIAPALNPADALRYDQDLT